MRVRLELVKLLADPDAMVARDSPAAVVRATGPLRRHRRLRAMVRKSGPIPLGRLHALWTLELLSSLEPASIELGLADPEPRVREAAIRLAETRLEHEPALLSRTLALAR